jgi:hypothetical protein
VRWRTELSRRGCERNKVKVLSLKLHDEREECRKGCVEREMWEWRQRRAWRMKMGE